MPYFDKLDIEDFHLARPTLDWEEGLFPVIHVNSIF